MSKDKTKCTVIYQGKEADLQNKAAVENLLNPMFREIHRREGTMARPYLFPELEPTAIELAMLVGRLEQVEDEKKAANDDFKERIDLLKIQIKQAARTINEGMQDGMVRVTMSKGETSVRQPSAPAGYEPVPEGKQN